MPDGTILDTTPPPSDAPSQAAPAPQPVATPAPVYTQEQVDAMMKQAHDSGAAAVRRSVEAKTRQEPQPTRTDPQPAATVGVEQMAAQVAREIGKQTAFAEAVQKYGFNEDQVALLTPLRDAAGLQDAAAVHAWVKEKAPLFGKSTNPAAPTATNQIPSVPAPISPSAPATAVPLERDVSVLEMNADQVHELMRKKGGDPSRPYHPSNRAARREIRIQTEAALRSRRIGLSTK